MVVTSGGKIEYAGPEDGSPPTSPSEVLLQAPCLMPGMWDAHVHFMGFPDQPKGDMMDCFLKVPVQERAMRTVKHAKIALEAGFTSVRDVGGMGGHLKQLVNSGEIPGPQIYSAFDIITMSGGHGDLNQYPSECLHVCQGGHNGHVCDGKSECLKAVRGQLRKGADLIKVCASGGVMSEGDSPMHQQFSDEELKVIVEEAGRSGRVVAAHCHGTAGINAALRAGCHTIEHGSYLDDEGALEMKKRGAILVPTRWIIEELVGKVANGQRPAGLSEQAYEKVCFIYNRHTEAIKTAMRHGVPIAAGSDMFLSAGWGRNGEEMSYYVNTFGMTELEAIESATANGPLTLGPGVAPRSGQLVEGFDADIIALESSPLEGNIGILGQPDKVVLVMKAGRVVKNLQQREQ